MALSENYNCDQSWHGRIAFESPCKFAIDSVVVVELGESGGTANHFCISCFFRFAAKTSKTAVTNTDRSLF